MRFYWVRDTVPTIRNAVEIRDNCGSARPRQETTATPTARLSANRRFGWELGRKEGTYLTYLPRMRIQVVVTSPPMQTPNSGRSRQHPASTAMAGWKKSYAWIPEDMRTYCTVPYRGLQCSARQSIGREQVCWPEHEKTSSWGMNMEREREKQPVVIECRQMLPAGSSGRQSTWPLGSLWAEPLAPRPSRRSLLSKAKALEMPTFHTRFVKLGQRRLGLDEWINAHCSATNCAPCSAEPWPPKVALNMENRPVDMPWPNRGT
ncbi:hypothetical protein B0T24DRAFT_147700 [Lasiosphaeria ovina]|uniref:Uncharacterized protein n=1 Tax=Lasiosphaeria ovina TaxID=92902 RepID=A0AAE0KMY5_9PEZI|nr:hypothetical protein B0T24DRAFT_147700 [Lasiosphaeria ovina]